MRVTSSVQPASRMAENSKEEFVHALLQQHDLCFKCFMATKQTTGSGGVIGSAVIPQ